MSIIRPKVLVNGTNTANKGAELMLYAIIQEIEKRNPQSELIYNDLSYKNNNKDLSYFETSLNIIKPFFRGVQTTKTLQRLHIYGILRKLNIDIDNYPTTFYKPDLFLDASGYLVTDKWNFTKERINQYKHFLEKLKQNGTKIVYMPQAFGPIKKENTKQLINIIIDNADLIYVRDTKSFEHICNLGTNTQKIKIYPDFTASVKGKTLAEYSSLSDYICIIPNQRMIDKGGLSKEEYLTFLYEIIKICRDERKQIYLLNHESKQDEQLCYNIASDKNLPVVTGLNALETKGFISNAYLVISSRFHGVASSLNSCVPCLSTSWSHKYEELYKDYSLTNSILDINYLDDSLKKVKEILIPEKNKEIRKALTVQKERHTLLINNMWDEIWDLLNNK